MSIGAGIVERNQTTNAIEKKRRLLVEFGLRSLMNVHM